MKHTSLYSRARSPFWWLAHIDPKSGKRVCRSTEVRIDDPRGRVKALEMARDASEETKALRPVLATSAWEDWAEDYLRFRYSDSPLTLSRAFNGWKVLVEWLTEKKIHGPAAISYQHAQEWVIWRTKQKRHSGALIKKNTALTDLRFLTILMREAMRRGWVKTNPLDRPGLGRDRVKKKPEITPDQDRKILTALEKKPQWMRDSYAVAMAQGCRLTETATPLADIDEVSQVITFDAKGDNEFGTRLHDCLIPLVKRRRAEGAKLLVDLPKLASKDWCFFLDEIGLPDHSFHCTRVTAITRLARAGVPIQQAMAFVGHANETIHAIYQRLSPPDLVAATAALSRPASSGTSETQGDQRSTPPRPSRGRSARRGRGNRAGP